MIIYFTDRHLNITGQASTTLPGGLRVSADKLVEDVLTGVNSFEFTVTYDDYERSLVEEALVVGNFVLRSSDRMGGASGYNSLFQIIETEHDTSERAVRVYAEDAGLELINSTCDAVKLSSKTLTQMIQTFLPSDWTLRLVGTPSDKKTYEWTGESTTTERIKSVANIFKCELYYTFKIERFSVIEKILNIVPRRGNQTAIAQFRLNQEVNKITTKTTMTSLATALSVVGGTDSKGKTVTLKNYDYNYTDSKTGDKYKVDKSTGQMRNTSAMKRWASAIDNDGLIVKRFQYDTDKQSTLAGQARAELQKLSNIGVEYEVEFLELPEEIQIGDRINIIDEYGELYLDARLLTIETSVADNEQKTTIGEYILREGGISSNIQSLSNQIRDLYEKSEQLVRVIVTAKHIDIGNTLLTARVYKGNTAITTQNQLESNETLQWYKDEVELQGTTGFTLNVNLAQGTAYACKLLEDVE